MNNLSTHLGPQRSVPPGAMDVWNQGQAPQHLGMPSPHQTPTPASPAAIVQRLLRGRVALAIVLGLIGAIIGAGAGYMSQAPTYNATGQLLISPLIQMIDGDKTMPQYQNFMNSETQRIASPQILNELPKLEPWKTVVGKNNEALADLGGNVKIAYPRQSFNINIDYSNPDPKIASAGVQTLIKAYQNHFKTYSNTPLTKKITELEGRIANLTAANATSQKMIDDITATYGTPDLQNLVAAAQNKVETIDRELRGNENNYKAATDAIVSLQGTNGKVPLSELAAVEPVLASMINDLRTRTAKMQVDERLLGAQHRSVQQQKIAIGVTESGIEAMADTIRKEILAIIPDFVKGGGDKIRITPGDLKVLETRVNTLRTEIAEAKKVRDTIAADAGKVAYQQTAMKTYERDLTKMSEDLTNLRYTAAAAGNLEVMRDGSFAVKASDKKILLGLAGAIGGACVPVALLMLLGLMDTRFRYSDDAAGQSMAGIPLLGILPNLPDRLSDPAQASIAAHCVHQIRTMLQLNSMRDASTAFAITSASSGDGKTSLSLALGLSFAASGSRTLLIDADLVGGGLTSRLGNDTSVGIVDALAGVGLEECVQPTDVADLSLLPIGSAQAHHAGSFSPPAVRKLLNEVRKHYEVIIIDTGPVMGSIEATPIAASVDGVVLTVARGQSRPLVERAITHLNSIGAKVAGVVFNRAQHKDFEQSIGAISVRSAARSTTNGTGHNGRKNGDMGAVAAAVATSVRNEN